MTHHSNCGACQISRGRVRAWPGRLSSQHLGQRPRRASCSRLSVAHLPCQIELNPRFFEAITNAPVPVDMRALWALKRSPLALDLYAFVGYRAFVATQSGRAQFVTWEQLMGQLGTDYGRIDNFRAKAKAALRKIKVVFPGVILGGKLGGIEILPGASAVPPKRARQRALPPVDRGVIHGETVVPEDGETVVPEDGETVVPEDGETVVQPVNRIL